MFEITSGRGSSAARPSTGRVPDLGQVPEHDPGIMTPGLPPVITLSGRQRPDLDQHLPLPGGEPPRPVPAGRSGVIGGGEGEPWAARRIVPVWFASSRGPGAAVPDRMPVLVGNRHAPGRAGVTGRSRGQVPGQVRVDRPDPAQLSRPVRTRDKGGRGNGEIHVPGEPGRDHPGQRPARPRGRSWVLGPAGDVRAAAEGPGVHAEQDVQERPGPQRVQPALQARLTEFPGPRGDALVRGQHLRGRQFPPGQAGVSRRLGPPFHPGLLRRVLPSLLRLARGDLHDCPG